MSTKLMEEIMSDANLDLARKAVKKNKGDCETDGMTGADLDKFIEENKNQICEQIRKRQYRPLPVRRKEIPKPDGFMRKLGIPCVIERWIQQAAYQVLCSIFEQVFSETSYEFRPGCRCENAIIKALEYFNDRIRGWINYLRIAKGIKEKMLCSSEPGKKQKRQAFVHANAAARTYCSMIRLRNFPKEQRIC